jgi:hypothetical protein
MADEPDLVEEPFEIIIRTIVEQHPGVRRRLEDVAIPSKPVVLKTQLGQVT